MLTVEQVKDFIDETSEEKDTIAEALTVFCSTEQEAKDFLSISVEL